MEPRFRQHRRKFVQVGASKVPCRPWESLTEIRMFSDLTEIRVSDLDIDIRARQIKWIIAMHLLAASFIDENWQYYSFNQFRHITDVNDKHLLLRFVDSWRQHTTVNWSTIKRGDQEFEIIRSQTEEFMNEVATLIRYALLHLHGNIGLLRQEYTRTDIQGAVWQLISEINTECGFDNNNIPGYSGERNCRMDAADQPRFVDKLVHLCTTRMHAVRVRSRLWYGENNFPSDDISQLLIVTDEEDSNDENGFESEPESGSESGSDDSD